MHNSKSIGNKIAEARKKSNMTQAELGEKVFISAQAVGKWERDESLPDIATLNRLADILGVDLNYFSDREESGNDSRRPSGTYMADEIPSGKPNKKLGMSWNMSSGNWVDADFSGLKNLQEKFSSSNMKNCKFHDSDLSRLVLASNNIEKCDFTGSDLRDSQVRSSNLLGNDFSRCSFIDALFAKDNIGKCNFTEADFSGTEFNGINFESNAVTNARWKFTAFKNSGISDIVFEGTLEDCHFENCSFYGVKFQNATLRNCFFKYNRKFKKVQFINCQVDKLTYAFLKNNQADLTGVTVSED